MIEIQCTSCNTLYRIDERILPDETPTFKCSRCGHVFSAEPRQKTPRRAGDDSARATMAAKSASPAEAKPASRRPPPEARADASAAEQAATASQQPPPPAQPEPSPAAAAPAQAEAPLAHAARPRLTGIAGRRADAAPQTPRPDAPQEPVKDTPPRAIRKTRDATQELLQRRFGNIDEDEDDRTGKNLSFDFSDETDPIEPPSQSHSEDKWEVGDTDLPSAPPPRPKRRIRISDIDDDFAEGGTQLDRPFTRMQSGGEPLDTDEDEDFEKRIRPEEVSAQARRLEAELRNTSFKIHSAGYFLGLFAMVVVGFGIVTMVIQSAPIVSAGLLSALPIVGAGLQPPISAAQRVALGEVQAEYVKLKGSQTALVLSGTAENLTSTALGAVQIEAALTASGAAPLRTQAVYCGNGATLKTLAEMTPHEIEFFEKLDAPKNFTLAPQATTPFVIVFTTPPAGASHFQLRIVRADPAAAPPAPPSEGG